MKSLTIRHFGPIEEVYIELKRVNLILGPQSSGKSTVLKVACFCDWMERKIALSQDPERYCQPAFFVQNLIGFHKLEGFMREDSFIKYENDSISFEYDAKSGKCDYHWAENADRWNYRRSKIAYIPSERNLVAAIPNWYQVSMTNNNILDFMKEWEFARKHFPQNERILNLPFSYRYNPNDKADRIVMSSGEEVELTNASSGLQSLIPLFVMLCYLTGEYYSERHEKVEDAIIRQNLEEIVLRECAGLTPERQKMIIDNMLTPYRTDIYIEEPEAHIFPSTQKDFVYTLIKLLNGERKHFCFISTHSPYLMTSFNNLIQAGEMASESREMADKVGERFAQTLSYSDVAAFAMRDGSIESIMDEELHLISADALDEASDEISDDFNYLLGL